MPRVGQLILKLRFGDRKREWFGVIFSRDEHLAILPYSAAYREEVLSLAVAAWAPVFEKTKRELPSFIYAAFYPQGWEKRQCADVAFLLDSEPEIIWLALCQGELAGFVGARIRPNDHMGEIFIIAVAPNFQRRGISKALMDFAERSIRDAGMTSVMVETAADSGHEPARKAYEASGYERWPIVRYFKHL